MPEHQSYTDRAVDAVIDAIKHEHSVPEWLAQVLAAAAAEFSDGSHALIAGRPGSWEADLVDRLVKGTVGGDDEDLGDYRRRRDA